MHKDSVEKTKFVATKKGEKLYLYKLDVVTYEWFKEDTLDCILGPYINKYWAITEALEKGYILYKEGD